MSANHIQIGDITSRIQYTGDGAVTAFTYPFPIFDDADIEVYEDATLKTISTDYTVSGAGLSTGGTVTFVTAPASAVVVTLLRNLTIERTTDFQESGEFRSQVINDELDKQVAMAQQVNDKLNRSLRLASTDPDVTLTLPLKASRASKVLAFDSSGNAAVSTMDLSTIENGATSAAASATAAATSETNAATSETNAATSATNAASSATAAATAAASNLYSSIQNKSANFTVTSTDDGALFVVDTSAGNIVVTMPDIVTDVAEGFRVGFMKSGALNTITINRAGTDTINGGTSYVMNADTEVATMVADANTPDNWITFGASTTSAGSGLTKSGSTISLKPVVVEAIALGDETTPLVVGTSVVSFHAPIAFTLTDVVAGLTNAQTSGLILTFDINEAGVSILSTKLTIDNTEDTSTTATTPPVLSDTAIAAGAKLTVDIDQIGDGTAVGAKIYLVGYPA